jgi:peptidylprolyl isomerase
MRKGARVHLMSLLRVFKRRSVLSAGGFVVLLVTLMLSVVADGYPTTPAHGPLSKKPAIEAHRGPAPKRLVVKDIIRGTGSRAKNGDVLTVNYVGVLYGNNKIFDSSWHRRAPFTFPLGQGEVIEGWERGIVGMRVGGRRELIIPAALAYGSKGSPPTIPPNSTLIFVVDLLAT